MVATQSTMLPLGTKAPEFTLPDTDGRMVSLSELAGAKGVLVAFICNHCPYVKHVAPELARIAREYAARGIAFVGINSNDTGAHPEDSPEKMRDEKRTRGYVFSYLHDADQSVAKAYAAACTPDFYLFDRERKLVYRGQLDDTRPTRLGPGNYDSSAAPPTGRDLRAALDALIAGKPIATQQKASLGCNIKWRPGNEPEYFGGG